MSGGAGRGLAFRALAPDLAADLAAFFARLVESGATTRFHPHAFTPETAAALCATPSADYYGVALDAGRLVGYGMLRGWAAGYSIPSLGIAVDAAARGRGVGRALMLHLHAEAARRGAERIRLKVYPDNAPAVALYRSLGYAFDDEPSEGQLVGFAHLGPRP